MGTEFQLPSRGRTDGATSKPPCASRRKSASWSKLPVVKQYHTGGRLRKRQYIVYAMHMYHNEDLPCYQETQVKQLETTIRKGFKLKDGPFIKALDAALQSFNVARQAYYSMGNQPCTQIPTG